MILPSVKVINDYRTLLSACFFIYLLNVKITLKTKSGIKALFFYKVVFYNPSGI